MSLLAQTSTQQLVTSSITAVTAQFQTIATQSFSVSSINGIVPGAAFSGSTVALSTGSVIANSLQAYSYINMTGGVLSNVASNFLTTPKYTTTFTPTSISGLRNWFDASQTTSILSNGSGQAYQWNNLAGYGNATQGTTSNMPITGAVTINGLNVLNFPVGGFMNIPAINYTTSNRSAFLVVQSRLVYSKNNNFVSGDSLNIMLNNNDYPIIQATGGTLNNLFVYPLPVPSIMSNTTNIITLWLDPNSFTSNNPFYINGSNWPNQNRYTGSLATGNLTHMLGSNITDGFYFCEYIYYDTNLTVSQRQTVEGYLAWKWGTNGSLIATQPYYSTPPPPLGTVYLPAGSLGTDATSNITIQATANTKISLAGNTQITGLLTTSSIGISSINNSTLTQLITQPFQSTFTGLTQSLGTAGYISTAQLTSTVRGIGSGFTGSTIGLSAATINTSTINSVYLSSVQGYVSSLRTDSLTVGGPTGYVTVQDLTTATISTGQLVAGAGFISSLQINTLSFGPTGYVIVGDVIANSLSTTRLNTQALYTNNAYIGNVSSQSAILFPGIDGNYRGTAVAEQTTGVGTGELLLYKVSSTTDQIRLQTTGNLVFEVGAPSRSWNSTTQLATPSLYIQGSTSNVGVGTNTPATTFDVVGTGRFQILSSLSLNVSTINGAVPWQQFYLTSTVQGLGVAGYISSAQLTSTTQGLTRGLGSAGYISSTQLTSTVAGLTIVAANAFTGSTTSLSAGTIFVSSVKMNTMLISTMSMVDTTLVSTSGSITQDNLVLYFNTMPFAGTQAWFGQMIIPPGPPLTYIFSYTGASQTWVVPTSVNSINAYMWAAGGGGVATASGGAGAFVQAAVPVTPGETLTLIVGGGGGVASTIGSFGGGGAGGGGGFGTQGGGRTAIQRGSVGATDYIVVGAGGGGSGYSSAGAGGAGGISAGSPATGTTGLEGQGGTQAAGGAGTSGVISAGAAGSAGAGGAAGAYGGGGGSGYYGGGGSGATSGVGGSGGGGSSLVNNVLPIVLTAGSGGTAPNTASQFYVAPVAAGGTSISGTGGNGLIVVSYTAAPPAAPSGLMLTLNGSTATLSWTSAGVPLYYWAFYGNSTSAYTGTYLMSGSTAGTSVSYSVTATFFDYFRLVSLSPLGCISAIVSSPIVQVPAPSGLTLTASGTTVTMTWSAVADATSYTYTLFSNSSYAYSGASVATGSVGTNTATYSSGVIGTYYYFSVNAMTSYGTSLSTTSAIVQDSAAATNGSALMNSSGQYLSIPSNAAFTQNTAFTHELWFYPTNTTDSGQFWAMLQPSFLTVFWNGSNFSIDKSYVGNPPGYTTQNRTYAINNWYHVALSWNNVSSGYLFINGIIECTFNTAGVATLTANEPLTIGKYGPSYGSTVNGFYTNMRVVKGVAVYTGAFTPPTSPLQLTQSAGTNISAITTGQTQLLLNTYYGSNFLQDATGTFTVTNGGNVQSNTLSPFITVLPPTNLALTPAVGNTATLSWTASTGATGYSWIVYQSSTNGYFGTSFATGSTNSTTYSATVSGLNMASYYYFTVIATGTVNSAAAVSAIMYELPDAPTPTCTTSGITVNMSWTAITGALYYTYTVYQASGYAYSGIQVFTANNGNSLSATYTGVATNYYYFTVSVTTSAGTSALGTSGVAQAVALVAPTITTFSATGSDQLYTFPSNAALTVYMWAAAGGGTNSINGNFAGGAGAYVQGTLVATGAQYTIIVGKGGAVDGAAITTRAYKNGGAALQNDKAYIEGGGGGRSGLQLAGVNLIAVGAGGGAGGNGNGGAGGITSGANGSGPSTNYGLGGSQSAGGAAGTGTYNTASPGTQFGGGNAPTNGVGGGGGDGYYGGGGGVALGADQKGGGGGGGSSLTSNLSSLVTYVSSNGYSAPNTSSPYYQAGIAAGAPYATGGDGLVVISASTNTASPTNPTLVSSGGSATMSWTASAGATGYSWVLYQSATNAYAGSSFATGTTTSATTATTTGLNLNSYYYFTVSATGTSNTSAAVASAIVLQLITGPATATLSASATTLSLSWAAVAGASSYTYTIYSGTAYSYTGMAFVTSVSTASTSATYAGTAGTYYYFTATATTASGTSGPTASGLAQASAAAITATIGNATLTTDYTTSTTSGTTYYYFRATGKTMTFTPSASASITYLTIGGGGGGASGYGGGGGAGGLQQGTASLTASAYSIVIGTGGAGAQSTAETGPYYPGTNGVSTTFSGSGVSVTALGGGQGGPGYSPSFTPSSGGCGGGGGGTGPGIAGTGTQGYNGAAGFGGAQAGGGGGVGGAGSGSTGGIGITYNGSNYGGGGGGLGGTASYGGGGGGVPGSAGTANTGGGGGGSGWNGGASTFVAGGTGGSGICILSYGVPPSAATSPTLSITSGTATLGWTAGASATGYSWILYQATTSNYNGTSAATGTTATTSPTSAPTGLLSGKFWYFTVASTAGSSSSAVVASSIISY